ncbi:glutaredoxin 2 [Martelella endophytica]|uniref:GST N-terminal domain-containing protein n=1 Tax=Martelella endophytica TaxID=1486262 RepID=A0A0D5LT90_MAREN|nr:glutaredoxin 2 [Martelella endophytica]AJY46588.1 hypothetical protein TM49_14345 [Martelella endophytica]
MKLHVYDHCPFCLRARVALGLKGLPFELVFQANDDEATPIGMIGKKMLPILEDEDGYMGESLDIVAKVDGLSGARVFDAAPRQALVDWIERTGGPVGKLVTPRTPDAVYPEFRTESARAYFTRKKEANIGPFAPLIARADEYRAEMEQALAELVPILPDAEGASMEDVLLFPVLRSLSIVPDLKLPPAVEAYRDRIAERAGIPLVNDLRSQAA